MDYKWLIVGAVVILGGGALQYAWEKKSDAADVGGCTPEGGLACSDGEILVCRQGDPVPAGKCEGGCVERNGVARCLDAKKQLVAPEGAICRPGMGLCGLTPNTLLVCRDRLLVKAADCPGGCIDEGARGGLYCLTATGTLLFAEGFACPRFQPNVKFVCGADAKSLLKCEDDRLVRHSVVCAVCSQVKSGGLKCLDDEQDPIEPQTGRKIQ